MVGKSVIAGSEYPQAAACYVARIHGERSAALKFPVKELCPEMLILLPDMRKYSTIVGAVWNMLLGPMSSIKSVSSSPQAFRGSDQNVSNWHEWFRKFYLAQSCAQINLNVAAQSRQRQIVRRGAKRLLDLVAQSIQAKESVRD